MGASSTAERAENPARLFKSFCAIEEMEAAFHAAAMFVVPSSKERRQP